MVAELAGRPGRHRVDGLGGPVVAQVHEGGHLAVRGGLFEAAIGDLHSGVVMERHHALNWLIGYSERADWDDVTTDT